MPVIWNRVYQLKITNKNNCFILPAKASPIALPRLELKYELTAINDDGFMNPSPRPNLEYLEEVFLLVFLLISLSFQE